MNEQRKQFKSPWDLLLIGMTVGIVGLLLVINAVAGIVWVVVMNLAIIAVSAALGVYGYSIQEGKLKILRLGWSKDIDLSSIKNVEVKPLAMMGSIRTLGIGGLFSYMGNFKNGMLNSYKAYVTHREKTVLLTLHTDEQVVVSPDDPATFVESIRSEIGRK